AEPDGALLAGGHRGEPADRRVVQPARPEDPLLMTFRRVAKQFARRPLAMLGLVIVVAMVLVAIFAPQLAPYDPTKPDFTTILQAPSSKYLLGTDEVGRDLLSRLIYGARASIRAGIIAVLIAVGLGVPTGLLSGYVGGWLDRLVIMRLTDAMIAFPTIVLALALAAALGGNLTTAMLAIGIGSAPAFIRLARAQ